MWDKASLAEQGNAAPWQKSFGSIRFSSARFLKVPELRKQQVKQEKRDAKMLLGQNTGGNLNIKSGTRAAPAAQV